MQLNAEIDVHNLDTPSRLPLLTLFDLGYISSDRTISYGCVGSEAISHFLNNANDTEIGLDNVVYRGNSKWLFPSPSIVMFSE